MAGEGAEARRVGAAVALVVAEGKQRPATVDLVNAAARRDLAQGLGAPAS